MIKPPVDRTFDHLEVGKTYKARDFGGCPLGRLRFAEAKVLSFLTERKLPSVKVRAKPFKGNYEVTLRIAVHKFNAWREPYLEQEYHCAECGESVMMKDLRTRIKHFCATTGTDTWLKLQP